MGSESKRGNSRYPTYLVSGLLISNVYFMFKWWSLSAMNNELLLQVVDFGDGLKISADAHNACEVKIMQAEKKMKTLNSELSKIRDLQEESRVENVESKRKMLVKNVEDDRLQKECEYVQSSLETCKSELESHQHKEKLLDKTIRSMKRNEMSNTKNLDFLTETLASKDKTIEFLKNRDRDPSNENQLQLAKNLQIISSQDKALEACGKELKALQAADITGSELINALKREKERLLSNQQQLKKSPSSGPVLDALVQANQVDLLGPSEITEVKKLPNPSEKELFAPSQKPTEKLTKRLQKSTTEEFMRLSSQKTRVEESSTTTRSIKTSTQEYFVRKADQEESHILKNKVNELVPLPKAVTYLDTDINAHKDSIPTLNEKKKMEEYRRNHEYINNGEVKDEEEEEEKHASEELKEAEEESHADKRYIYKNDDKDSEDYEKRFEEALDI